MARSRLTNAFSASLALALLAGEARAGATIDLLFIGVDGAPIAPTSTVVVAPSSTLTMALIMINDQSLIATTFSLAYDLGGGDHLDVIDAFQWSGVPIDEQAPPHFFMPITNSCCSITATFVGSFQGATTDFNFASTLPPAGGAFAGGYQMGTVVWHASMPGVTNITGGIINTLVDVLVGAPFQNISNLMQSGVATVTVTPEPGTAALVGLALLGLALARHRRRS